MKVNTRIRYLIPGDRVEYLGVNSVFLGANDHPKYYDQGLAQVIWYFFEHPLGLKMTVDALSWEQEIMGEIHQTNLERHETLVKVMEELNRHGHEVE